MVEVGLELAPTDMRAVVDEPVACDAQEAANKVREMVMVYFLAGASAYRARGAELADQGMSYPGQAVLAVHVRGPSVISVRLAAFVSGHMGWVCSVARRLHVPHDLDLFDLVAVERVRAIAS